MASLATVEDLQLFLGAPDIDEPRAQLFLDLASGLIRRFANVSFEPGTDEEVLLDGTGTRVMFLPVIPVTAVTEVQEDGEVLDPDLWEWNANGQLRRRSGYWAQRFRYYLVTYSHSVTDLSAIRAICVRMAARGFNNPAGLTNETMGGYSAGFGGADRLLTLTDGERDEIREFLGR